VKRRLLLIVLTIAVLIAGLLVVHIIRPAWYVRLLPASIVRHMYPLNHGANIVESARKYRLDPALVAAVIYEESRFRQSTVSSRGAIGLMQLLPSTAREIARNTGGEKFVVGDLTDARINILYGCNYLRYLLDQFGGSTTAAVAAYNAGVANVREWIARQGGRPLRSADIPFAETRSYVSHVSLTTTVYRRAYGAELGAAPAGFAAIR
jgi:soluble lytic murein transglycosylase